MTDKVVIRESVPVVVREQAVEKVRVSSGLQGPPGPPGPSGDAVVFVQSQAPIPPGNNYMWMQTQIGPNNDMTLWVEDGT